MNPDVSIIIPAYNEESTIYDVAYRTMLSVSKIPDLSFEIIVIDDGSNDGTLEAFRELNITILKNITVGSM